jgi:hypothetical protein
MRLLAEEEVKLRKLPAKGKTVPKIVSN